MTAREQKLLENVLDALDRLFDRQSFAVDTWALLFATCEALRATVYLPELERPPIELSA